MPNSSLFRRDKFDIIRVCVARNSCVYLRFRVFYFLFFRFLLFVSELFRFSSDKRFQIFFYVPVFDSIFQSRIFSAINNNFLRNFSVSEFCAFQFLFIYQMPVLLFRLFLAVLYFVNFASRVRIIRNDHTYSLIIGYDAAR